MIKKTAVVNPAKTNKKGIEKKMMPGYHPNIAAMTVSITPA